MNRDIRFRGQTANGRWVYGSLVVDDSGILEPSIYYPVGDNYRRMEWVYVSKDSIGQFTGEYDSHNDEIYEGDTIWIEALKKEGEVVWNNSRLMIKVHDYETHTTTFYEISDISEFKKSGEVKSYI